MQSRAVPVTVLEGQWAVVKSGSMVLFYNEGNIEVTSR